MSDPRDFTRNPPPVPSVNPGYAGLQLAKALRTRSEHADLATRERAKGRVARWLSILDGLFNGRLAIGDREPIAGVPAWATLEVATGGFATGSLLAGGPLLEHERERLGRLGLSGEGEDRSALNRSLLTEDGLRELEDWLRTGCYRIDVPEEGALLVIAWLVRNGQAMEARALLDELAPFLSRLRFYPQPSGSPIRADGRVFLQDVGTTKNHLLAIEPNPRILAQKEAAEIWAPLYDRVVRLFLETLEGEPPVLSVAVHGSIEPGAAPSEQVSGGRPCRHFPEGWAVRAQALLADYEKLRKENRLCGKPERKKGTFTELRGFLDRCVDASTALGLRDQERVRLLLARYIAKRGLPDSPRHRQARASQAGSVGTPLHSDLAHIAAERLNSLPPQEGIDDLEPVRGPVSGEEGALRGVRAGTEIPVTVLRKLERSLRASIEVLVENGIVASEEVLARLVPQLTSGLGGTEIGDPALRQLYIAIYRAFRRRRSLLLLNLQKQVRIEELPWMAAIERRRDDLAGRELARRCLEEVAILALTGFPETILPNKLLTELVALAKQAAVDLPLVEEVAADIFMGDFSDKYSRAAQVALGLVAGSLYARYYGIDDATVATMRAWKPRPQGESRRGTSAFALLCGRRAGATEPTSSVAGNGMVIEQQQILTTQNLAVLFAGLGLAERLEGRLEELAWRCFVWICSRLEFRPPNRRADLLRIKNAAYAWRQMIFFLTFVPACRVEAFLHAAQAHLESRPTSFQERFRPALAGLTSASQGILLELDDEALGRRGARRFVGWSVDRHWLRQLD